MKEKQNFTGYFIYIGNVKLRYPEMYNKDYFKYLDEPKYRPYLNKKQNSVEQKNVFSSYAKPETVTNTVAVEQDIFKLFSPTKERKMDNHFSQYDNVDNLTASLMKVAEKEYPELWENDQGSLYKLSLQRFLPINRETISNWGEKETKMISEIISESTLLQIKINQINVEETIENMINSQRPKNTGLFGKFFKQESVIMSLPEMQELLTSIEKKLDDMKIEIDSMNKKIASRKRRTMIMATVLTIVAKSIDITDTFVYNLIVDKSEFLLNACSNLAEIERTMKDINNSTYLFEMKTKEFRDLTLPNIVRERMISHAK